VRRIRCRGHARRVARRSTKERRPANIDHLDRFIETDQLDPDGRGERLDVDHHQVDQADPLIAQLVELGLDVAAGKDACVDRMVERLDLAADHGRTRGQLRHRGDRDALSGKVVAGPVRGENLDIEGQQIPGKGGNPVPIRH
jgi:hypothetical protein